MISDAQKVAGQLEEGLLRLLHILDLPRKLGGLSRRFSRCAVACTRQGAQQIELLAAQLARRWCRRRTAYPAPVAVMGNQGKACA